MDNVKEKLLKYKERLEDGLCEYMESSITERNAAAVKGMIECWMLLEDMGHHCSCHSEHLTDEDLKRWNKSMVNDDGTSGGRWPTDQTTPIAERAGVTWEHITPECFNVAMNMMFSDYCKVADRFGVATAEFFAYMAKAFLFDRDAKGPDEKMAAYYHGIVDLGN